MTQSRPTAPESPNAGWADTFAAPVDRARALLAVLTLEEKVAQLQAIWLEPGSADGDVAPYQNDMSEELDVDAQIASGLGHITRPLGTRPVDATEGAAALAALQTRVAAANRFGIPAIAHEECLSGFTAFGATCYPVPLAWGATFDPSLIEEMGSRIGAGMRSVGAHQGLAPILDVVTDPRWGRTEETIGEDPYLVGVVASSYVRGLQSTGIVATLKHFIGYSASRGARNLGPVSIGLREFADVLAVPFEMAVAETGVKSVMNSYAAIDGVPSAADASLLTDLLRTEWGFEGTVVADYFAIGFLHSLHRTASTFGEAAAQALTAGIDVELPTVKAYGSPLVEEIRSGRVPEEILDRAVLRVLIQKAELGLLDPNWTPEPPALRPGATERIELDPPADRALARTIAERSVVLVRNSGALPLPAQSRRLALIGPTVDDPLAMLGCYAFPNHVGVLHPGTGLGVAIPTVLDAFRAEFPDAAITSAAGCTVSGDDTSGIESAATLARDSDVAVVVVGDIAGLFGRGTSGEGCDAESLRLPGCQRELLDAVLATGTPTIVIVLSGRPYHLGAAPQRAAAIVQAFFPGEEGASAIAGVVSGRINPSGRLPVSIPASDGAQPITYLSPSLGKLNDVSVLDPTPAYGFGHGLGYSEFDWSELRLDSPATLAMDGTATVSLRVTNLGERSGIETVQLYATDEFASVVQPVRRLIAWAQVPLQAAESATVEFEVPADVLSFTGPAGRRIVEAGDIRLTAARSSEDAGSTAEITLEGATRTLGADRRRHCAVAVTSDSRERALVQ